MSNLDSQTLMERMSSGYVSDYIVKVYEHIPNGSNFLKDKRQYSGTFQSMMDYVMGLMHRVSDIPSHAIVFNQDTGEEHQINSDGSYIILKKQFNEGGEVEDGENKEMLENQVINILHHAEELKKVLPNVKEVEAWVITKIQRSVTDLADVTHYLEGETKDKYAEGGEVGEYNAMYFKQSVTRDGSKIDTMRERMVFSGSIESVLRKALPNFNPLDSYVLINDRKTGSVVAKMTPDGKAKLYDKNAKVIDEIEVEQEVEKKEDEPKKKLFGLFAEGGIIGGLTADESIYLYIKRAIVQKYREKYLKPAGLWNTAKSKDVEQSLIKKGFLNNAGAITEVGKNRAKEVDSAIGQMISRDYISSINLPSKYKEIVDKFESYDKMAEGGIASENANDKFYKWYVDWLKSVNEYVNVSISIPNEFSSPIKDGKGKIVILDVIEKKGDTDAKKYMNEILEKADEFGVSIYLQPIPRTHNLKSQEHKNKITKDYLIKYYQKFGFKNMDGGFMVREPKMAEGGMMAKGGNMEKSKKINGFEVDYFKTASGVYANIEIPQYSYGLEIDPIRIEGFGKDEKEAFNDLEKEYEKYLKKSVSGIKNKYIVTFGFYDDGEYRVGKSQPISANDESEAAFKLKDEFEMLEGIECNVISVTKISKEGGIMAKGGKIYKIQVKDKYDIQPNWKDDTWHTGGKKYLSFKDAQVAVKKLQGDTAYAHQEFKVVEDKEKMADGGKVKFKDKVKATKKSLLERKKVSPKVQKDYGKTYSPKEAEESAKRIVGSMTAKERLKKKLSKGGSIRGRKLQDFKAPTLEEIRGWSDDKLTNLNWAYERVRQASGERKMVTNNWFKTLNKRVKQVREERGI